MAFQPRSLLLSASRLTKRFGAVAAVKNLDLEVRAGDFMVIFGPNGAGKTTLLQMLASLSRPTKGKLEWCTPDPDRERCGIGYVSHQSLLYSELSGLENLEFFSRLYGLKEPRTRALDLLAELGLHGARHRQVKHYSSGMKQRLTLARALLHEPELLLLDEPYAGLDQHGSRLLTGLLGKLKERNSTVLLVTHNLLEGLALSNRVLIMNRGEIAHQTDSAMEPQDLEQLYFRIIDS